MLQPARRPSVESASAIKASSQEWLIDNLATLQTQTQKCLVVHNQLRDLLLAKAGQLEGLAPAGAHAKLPAMMMQAFSEREASPERTGCVGAPPQRDARGALLPAGQGAKFSSMPSPTSVVAGPSRQELEDFRSRHAELTAELCAADTGVVRLRRDVARAQAESENFRNVIIAQCEDELGRLGSRSVDLQAAIVERLELIRRCNATAPAGIDSVTAPSRPAPVGGSALAPAAARLSASCRCNSPTKLVVPATSPSMTIASSSPSQRRVAASAATIGTSRTHSPVRGPSTGRGPSGVRNTVSGPTAGRSTVNTGHMSVPTPAPMSARDRRTMPQTSGRYGSPPPSRPPSRGACSPPRSSPMSARAPMTARGAAVTPTRPGRTSSPTAWRSRSPGSLHHSPARSNGSSPAGSPRPHRAAPATSPQYAPTNLARGRASSPAQAYLRARHAVQSPQPVKSAQTVQSQQVMQPPQAIQSPQVPQTAPAAPTGPSTQSAQTPRRPSPQPAMTPVRAPPTSMQSATAAVAGSVNRNASPTSIWRSLQSLESARRQAHAEFWAL